MEVYLKKDYSKDPKVVRKIAYKLKETVLEDIATEFLIDVTKMSVKVVLDKDKLRNLGMTEATFIKVLSKSLRNIQVRANKNEIVLKGKEEGLNDLYALREKAYKSFNPSSFPFKTISFLFALT